MANKELTARVRLDSSDAESKLKRLNSLIQGINKAVTGHSNTSQLENKLSKQLATTEKLRQATLKTQLAEEKVTTQKNKSAIASQKVNEATAKAQIAEQRLALQTERTKAGIERIKNMKDQVANKSNTIASRVLTWAKNQQMVNSATKSTNGLLGSIGNKLKMLASTYLGIMGMKAAITTSDTLTGTQNKLNNLNGGDKDLTQLQMDKMYASANKVRMAYTDMASNASKSMTLAGGAFQGSMDNAIRFQEIMAETYTLGGASAEEMSTSMYQMIQALGAGTLAGDELRSVREGAPLAYKAIEEFAQGVYNSKESLKDMAAQGLITSEMVVAAVMNAGDKIDEQFQNTAMTFGQAWNRIKNSAVKAFEPVSNALNDMLNRAAKNGAFEKIEQAFWNISKAIQIVFKVIEKAVTWLADNWNWLKHIIIGALIAMIAWQLIKTGISIFCAYAEMKAWMLANGVTWANIFSMLTLLGIIAVVVIAVLSLVYVFILWKMGAIDTCQAIVSALIIVGVAVALIGLLMGNWIIVIVGLAIAAIGLIINWLDYFLAILYSIVSVIWNLIVTLVTAIIKNAILPLTTAWDNFANFFANIFNDPITTIIRAFEKLADSVLSILETIACGIDAIFGSNLASAVQGWRKGLSSAADKLVDKYGNGTYEEKSNVTSKVVGVLDSVQSKLLWNTSDAWSTGMSHGSTAKDWLNGVGSQFQSDGVGSNLDNIGNKLGLDFSDMADGFPNVSDPAYDTAGAYNMPENLKATADNTGDIADSMDLAEEDLEYLRKIAAMEWKKEFTTATITVDMSNYNTINGENDLDGIVTKLSDKLREELNVVANGVYA